MSIFFRNRDGQTPLEESMRVGLIPTHINDMTELYEYEIENIALGIEWTKKTKKDHRDLFVWIELHKHILSNVWKWAGQIRKRELANPDFLMPYDVWPALKQLEGDLEIWLTSKTYQDKELAALFHERLLTIHPFNDGNGRWARILTNMVCEREKKEVPNWGMNITSNEKRRNKYINAVKKARKDREYVELIKVMYYEV